MMLSFTNNGERAICASPKGGGFNFFHDLAPPSKMLEKRRISILSDDCGS